MDINMLMCKSPRERWAGRDSSDSDAYMLTMWSANNTLSVLARGEGGRGERDDEPVGFRRFEHVVIDTRRYGAGLIINAGADEPRESERASERARRHKRVFTAPG